MRRSSTSAISVSLIVLAIAVVYLLTGAPPESSASDPLPRLRSDYPLVAGNESTLEYTDARYGYTVGLPAGWRTAPEFMLAFAETNGRPQAGGNAEDYAVFTSLSADAEAQFVQNAPSRADELTGLAGWLEFFLLDTVELFPTARDLNSQLSTADQGNVKHLVSAIQEVSLNTSQTATRYTVELVSDYGHYIYDRVFVPGPVVGCPECTGFIVSTAVAGRSPVEPSSQTEPPAAAYPAEEFEAIFRSFRLPEGATPTPAKLPDTGGQPSQVEQEFLSFVSEDAGFTIEYPANWLTVSAAASPGAFHVAWLDPQALATPATRGELGSGAKIDLQAIRGAPMITSADRLVDHTVEGPGDPQILGSGTRPVADYLGYWVEFQETNSGITNRVTTVTWSDGAVSFYLTLNNGYAHPSAPYVIPPGEMARFGTSPQEGCHIKQHTAPEQYLMCGTPAQKWHIPHEYALGRLHLDASTLRVIWDWGNPLSQYMEFSNLNSGPCAQSEGDGYSNLAETYLATDPNDQCGGSGPPSSAWPSDLNWGGPPLSTNRVNVLDLTSFLAPARRINSSPGDAGYDARWDLIPGPGGTFNKDINVLDITRLITEKPPMFGGSTRSFNGPSCTP